MAYRNVSDEMIVASSHYTKEETYWFERLAGEPEKTSFPYDYDPEVIKAGEPDREPCRETVDFRLTGDIFAKLLWLANDSDYRLHMVLTAALLALLIKYSYNGDKDSIAGMPVYRQEAETGGEFLNTMLILRNRVTVDMTFKELLLQVKQTVGEALQNQNYPFELLMERLNICLPDIFILVENIQDRSYIRTNRFYPDMIFSFTRGGTDGFLSGQWEYNSSLYKKSTLERMITYFRNLLGAALFNPDIRLRDIDILAEQEKQFLLGDLNNETGAYPADKTLQGLFEEQVEKRPDHTAVIGMGHTAYNELNRASNRLARLLREKGVRPGAVVGLMMEPSPDMITAILGVLKAGGAYLPVDPVHPGVRAAGVLADCCPGVLLTHSESLKNHSFTMLQSPGPGSVELAKPTITAPCPQIKPMDDLPFPDRSLVTYKKYNRYIGQAMVKHCMALQATRGCPYNCTYCHKIWPKKQVVRSADNIFEEVNLYYRMGVRRFAFIDDIFNLDMKNSSKFFQWVIRDKLDVQFFFPNGLRGDLLTKEYIDLLVEAGTIDAALALETASPRLQKLIKKNLDLERFEKNLCYFQKKYPQVILELFTMHGFPTETEEEAMMTLEFIKRQKWLHFPYVHILKIYPNTDMAELAMQNGISGEAIAASANLAFHELPHTLPFDKSFTLNYQANFLNDYFLSKERLLHVLPYQMKVLTREEVVEKYDSYLPVDISDFDALLKFTGIDGHRLEPYTFLDESAVSVPDLDRKIKEHFSPRTPRAPAAAAGVLRILLLDLSQFFSDEEHMLYDVVEPPLGLMYLLTYLNRQFGDRIMGKIAKSRIDFDNYDELKALLMEFKPDIIGMRTLTFYKDFFHQAAAVIRLWGITAPILAGGPYATSDYHALLQDRNIDLAVLGEGEISAAALVEKILETGNRLPSQEVLEKIPGIAFIPDNRKQSVPPVVEVIPLDRLNEVLTARSGENPGPPAQPGDLAYIIFTSGSTGKPKGVMIEHRHVVRLLFNDRFQFDFSHRDTWTMFHSYCFDFSVWEMYGALLYGGKLVLVSRMIARDTEKFLELLKKEKVTVLNQTPSAFYSLMEIQAGCNDSRLNLRYVIFGGEALNPAKLKEWHRQYPGIKLINMFGITETTVHVTYKEITGQEIEAGIGNIGKPIPTLSAYIMDSCQRLLPPGVPGELYVGGAGVGRGYLNRPGLTNEKFLRGSRGRFFQKEPPGRRRLYSTGDLARILENGDIEYLGRIDQQVQIRGYRVEPGEIEKHLLKHPRVKDALVMVKEAGEDRYLCAYIVPFDVDIDVELLKSYLSQSLPDYMIPAFFVLLAAIPLTVNGKTDKKALPEPLDMTGTRYKAPGNVVEEKLVEIWSEVLGRDALYPSHSPIGIDDNFFDLGGHSLKATILISRIHKRFEVKIPLVELFRAPTIRGLAENIGKAVKEGLRSYTSIDPGEEREYYPLSPAQKRLYFTQQMEPSSRAYNIPCVYSLAGNPDFRQLEVVFKRMIRRHESFRTSFPVVNGKPVQRVHREVEFEIEYFLATEDPEGIQNSFIRSFDLARAPLVRVGLIKTAEQEHILMLDIHHIITDAFSMGIFINEFTALYSNRELPRLKLQYKDFSFWMNLGTQKEVLKKQEAFWLELFRGNVPALKIPTDFSRPFELNFDGGHTAFEIGEQETLKLINRVREAGVTLFIFLFSIYSVLLAKLSSQEDIVVGTAASGRRHTELEQVMGMFVNTLAMRFYPHSKKTFREFLKEAASQTIQAFENQDYPFEDLVEKLNIKRDRNRNPLFDVMFELQNVDLPGVEIPGLTVKPYPLNNNISKFDLHLTGMEARECLYFTLAYNKALFKQETVEKFAAYFKTIVTLVLEDPDKKLSQIELISMDRQQRFQSQFNVNLEDE
jgi:amino acid adenylation domain-containing protein